MLHKFPCKRFSPGHIPRQSLHVLTPTRPAGVSAQAYGGDALLQNMENLFSDGKWTEADVAKVCDTWKAHGAPTSQVLIF